MKTNHTNILKIEKLLQECKCVLYLAVHSSMLNLQFLGNGSSSVLGEVTFR